MREMLNYPQNKKVIIAVANNIVSDTRVRKIACTLQKNAFDLMLVGVGKKRFLSVIDGCSTLFVTHHFLINIYKKIFKSNRFNVVNFVLLSTALFLFIVLELFATVGNGKFMLPQITYLFIISAILFLFAKSGIFKFLKTYVFLNLLIPFGYRLAASSLYREMKKYQGCVIHAHDIVALIAAIRIKQLYHDTIIIWDAHEIYTELNYKSKIEIEYIHRTLKTHSHKINYFVTINESIAAYYAENYPDLPKASILMNATYQDKVPPNQLDRLRKTANIADNQKILLFQGGLAKNRGIDYLLDAAKELPGDWTIVFMGDGVMVNKINFAIRETNKHRQSNRPAITILPAAPLEELNLWTASATLGAITYENSSLNQYYCTPNKLWEYPRSRVPIIATDLPEISKIIKKYKIGILLPRDFNHLDILEILNRFTDKELKILKKNCEIFNKTENWEKYEKVLLGIHSEAQLS